MKTLYLVLEGVILILNLEKCIRSYYLFVHLNIFGVSGMIQLLSTAWLHLLILDFDE